MQKEDIKSFEKEFSKNAKNYSRYNIVQKKVAKKLISKIKNNPKNILDLGCGTGELYKLIDWNIEKFTAVDISEKMCTIHPKNNRIKVINADYEDEILYRRILKNENFDLIISSSSLQWCRDIEKVVKNISNFSKKCAVSIFCDGTFKTIYDISALKTFLPNSKKVIKIFQKYFDIKYEIENYKLHFEDNFSKFRYIKRSGVSGGKRQLSYAQTKYLIENYPLDYLEFEILYITVDLKCF